MSTFTFTIHFYTFNFCFFFHIAIWLLLRFPLFFFIIVHRLSFLCLIRTLSAYTGCGQYRPCSQNPAHRPLLASASVESAYANHYSINTPRTELLIGNLFQRTNAKRRLALATQTSFNWVFFLLSLAESINARHRPPRGMRLVIVSHSCWLGSERKFELALRYYQD